MVRPNEINMKISSSAVDEVLESLDVLSLA